MKPLLYLASPYTHASATTMALRASLAAVAAARIVDEGNYYVYSPIVHNHIINRHMKVQKPSWDFWGPMDMHFLRFADCFAVLTLDGWRESHGVREECRFVDLVEMKKHYIRLNKDETITWFENVFYL